MSNPQLLYTDLSSVTFSASLATDANYPVSNLSNYIVSSYWQGNTTNGNQFIQMDFGAPVSSSAICIDGHNFTSISVNGVSIDASDTADFEAATILADLYLPADDTTIHATWSPVVKRYYRIRYYSDFAMGVKPRLGNVFIGMPFTFSTPYQWGFKSSNPEYVTATFTSLSGITRTSQNYKGRLVYELAFTLQNDTARTGFQSFIKSIRGKLYPFYFIDTDGVTRYVHLQADYQPVQTTGYGMNTIDSLVMKSAEAKF
jgi:hypothetical protein